MAEESTTVEIFCCYAHEDETWLHKLETHLSLLKRQGLISLWHDRLIVAGTNWTKTIDTHLEIASVILLLVSADFLASDYCVGIEMKRALEREAAGEARVIPILVRPVDWTGASFAHLQALPTDAKPLASWRNKDAALADVAAGIRRVIVEELPQLRTSTPKELGMADLSRQPPIPPEPAWIRLYRRLSSRPQALLLTPEDRRRLLERLRSLYQEAVEQFLKDMPPMELDLERTFEATAHPALSVVSYRPADVREAIAPGTPILDVYQKAGDGLLILGKPGVGKSTLLCNLALVLTERAERDATQLPPVLVSLTSWAQKRLPLEQWLAEELQTTYQIQRTLATGWLRSNQLLPLLDGLDEMAEEARSACIEAINTYRQDHPLPIVVSSRSAEYLSLERKLHLQSAIEVQLLTPQQVDGYLKSEGKPLEAVRTALQTDAVLRDLVTTPLMLTVVTRVYRGETILPHLGTAEERQRQVFEHYVTRMLEPTVKLARKWRYPSDSAKKWLIWLAQQMKQHRLTEFYLERLQPSWLLPTVATAPTSYPCLTTLVIMLLSAGFSFGLLFVPLFVSDGNPGWFVVGLFLFICTAWGYALGVPFGFGLEMMGFSRKRSTLEVRPAELLSWSWKGSWLKMLLLLVGVALITPVGFHMPYWLSNLMGLSGYSQPSLVTELLIGLFLGVALVACIILITGVSSTHLSKQRRTAPNQGIHNSGWNALRVGLACMGLFSLLALFGGWLAGWSTGISGAWEAGPAVGLVIGAFAGPFFGLFFGGGAYLQHYILRFLLWRAGSAPWHYVRFLNEAKERILLQRVGGGYRFIHPLFQEYFASLGTGTPANSQSQPSSSPQP